jgi:hypothetical protein
MSAEQVELILVTTRKGLVELNGHWVIGWRILEVVVQPEQPFHVRIVVVLTIGFEHGVEHPEVPGGYPRLKRKGR